MSLLELAGLHSISSVLSRHTIGTRTGGRNGNPKPNAVLTVPVPQWVPAIKRHSNQRTRRERGLNPDDGYCDPITPSFRLVTLVKDPFFAAFMKN
ncbi:hypothetical protein [Paraburkholderia lycopersici]|uniref:hypothetical protein n=1 Tax=Paraburkholderia lycopersici TaxID=416944 RepID=UPI0011614C1F|nr:hypothetical protein [Paraburkholderia lycopersici]